MILDHFAFAGTDLGAPTKYIETRLGCKMTQGGSHPRFGTHNQLMGCRDGLYLESIAIDPDAPPPATPRWFDLDNFTGPARLSNWICRVPDLDAALAQFGPDAGNAVTVTRGALTWRMAVPDSGILPYDNCFPALIEWQGAAHPTHNLPISPISLKRFEISHPNAAELEKRIRPFLSDTRITFHNDEQIKMRALFAKNGEEIWL